MIVVLAHRDADRPPEFPAAPQRRPRRASTRDHDRHKRQVELRSEQRIRLSDAVVDAHVQRQRRIEPLCLQRCMQRSGETGRRGEILTRRAVVAERSDVVRADAERGHHVIEEIAEVVRTDHDHGRRLDRPNGSAGFCRGEKERAVVDVELAAVPERRVRHRHDTDDRAHDATVPAQACAMTRMVASSRSRTANRSSSSTMWPSVTDASVVAVSASNCCNRPSPKNPPELSRASVSPSV